MYFVIRYGIAGVFLAMDFLSHPYLLKMKEKKKFAQNPVDCMFDFNMLHMPYI